MSLSGLAYGALLLLGAGAAVAVAAPAALGWLKQQVSKGLSSLLDGAHALLSKPAQAVGELKDSYDAGRLLRPRAKDPVTSDIMGGYFGNLGATGTAEQQAQAQTKALRAKENISETVKRLETQKAVLEQTGQPYVIDLDSGEKLTLADINQRLYGARGAQ